MPKQKKVPNDITIKNLTVKKKANLKTTQQKS